jgi:opacity protein-like surface antigen
MANVLVDLDWSSLSPYIGGGIGYVHTNRHLKHGIWSNKDSSSAYQGILGISYPFCRGFDIGLEYRYFHVDKQIAEHSLGAATRFMF